MIAKEGKLSLLPELPESSQPVAKPFKSEEEFAKLVFGNRRALFGEKTVGWKMSVPDSVPFQNTNVLFDFTTPTAPRCYFLCVILGNGKDFYSDFFPFMTHLFSVVRDVITMSQLIVFMKESIEKDKAFLKLVHQHMKGKRLEDLLAETLLNAPRCLLVTEDPLKELPIAQKAYAETWGGILDVLYVRKFLAGKTNILSLHPTLSELQAKPQLVPKESKPKVTHTEEHHFAKGSPIVKSIYENLKRDALKLDKKLTFNAAGGHYISMKKVAGKNLCFFHFRKNSMYLVVKAEEKSVRKMVKKAEVKSLPASVQKFWNGSSTGLVISNIDQAREVSGLFRQLVKQ